MTQRRRAQRPADLPEDRREEREQAYIEWGKSARRRGNQVVHNEGCLCTSCGTGRTDG